VLTRSSWRAWLVSSPQNVFELPAAAAPKNSWTAASTRSSSVGRSSNGPVSVIARAATAIPAISSPAAIRRRTPSLIRAP
jgi:hypothetical protein